MCLRTIVLVLALAACGGGEEDERVSVTVTPGEGGTLTSADGRFTLDVLPGAVAEPTTISVRRAPAGEVPEALAGLVYDLQPDGLGFAVPAVARVTLSREEAGLEIGELPTTGILTRDRDGTVEELPAPLIEGEPDTTARIDIATGDVVVRGAATHFSLYFLDGRERATIVVEGLSQEPVMLAVGQSFTISYRVTSYINNLQIYNHRARTCAPDVLRLGPQGMELFPIDDCPGRWSGHLSLTVPDLAVARPPPPWTFCCEDASSATFAGSVWIAPRPMAWLPSITPSFTHNAICTATPPTTPTCDALRPTTDSVARIGALITGGLCGGIFYTPLVQAVLSSYPTGTVPPKEETGGATSSDVVVAVNTAAPPIAGCMTARVAPPVAAAVADDINLAFPCGQGPNALTLCPPGQPAAPPGDYLIAGNVMKADIPLADPANRYQFGIVFDSDNDPANNYQAAPQYPNDFFDGTDRWYVAEYSPAGGWVLRVTDATGGAPVDVTATSGARLAIAGNFIFVMAPATELASPAPPYRVTSFRHTGDYGLNPPHDWDGDVEPPVARGLAPFGSYP